MIRPREAEPPVKAGVTSTTEGNSWTAKAKKANFKKLLDSREILIDPIFTEYDLCTYESVAAYLDTVMDATTNLLPKMIKSILINGLHQFIKDKLFLR